eukprot:COSAG05_NODE_2126_length_3522_cov_3.381245_1_plen_71_part_00
MSRLPKVATIIVDQNVSNEYTLGIPTVHDLARPVLYYCTIHSIREWVVKRSSAAEVLKYAHLSQSYRMVQ